MAAIKTTLLLIIACSSIRTVYGDYDECFCWKRNGFYSEETNSCFVRFGNKKSYEDSHEACKAESSDGWTGRLAILPTQEVLDSVKRNVAKFDENKEKTWVALQSTVSGSKTESNWFWHNGTEPVLAHTYGMIILRNSNSANCARYKAKEKAFVDRKCHIEFARLCEFVSERSQPPSCVCNNGDNNETLCTYCLVGSYTSNTIPFQSTYGAPEDKPSLLDTISPEAVVRLMWSGPSSADFYAANYPDRTSFQPLCSANNAMLSIGQKSSDGQKNQTNVEVNLTGDDPQIWFILYCGNGILSGEVIYMTRSVIHNRTKIDGDIHSIECVPLP